MKKLLVALILAVSVLPLFGETEIAGVSVGNSVSLGGRDFSLKGAGIRKKLILKLYVGSLYTDRDINDESDILKGPASSVIRLDIISDLITSELMQETVQEGFDKAMGGDTSSLQPQIDRFIGVFSEEIEKGDQFTFVSIPGGGVTAWKGDRELTEVNDDRFREVLFSIWLGDEPADRKLKKAMLGG